jgi:hypothetical protein
MDMNLALQIAERKVRARDRSFHEQQRCKVWRPQKKRGRYTAVTARTPGGSTGVYGFVEMPDGTIRRKSTPKYIIY